MPPWSGHIIFSFNGFDCLTEVYDMKGQPRTSSDGHSWNLDAGSGSEHHILRQHQANLITKHIVTVVKNLTCGTYYVNEVSCGYGMLWPDTVYISFKLFDAHQASDSLPRNCHQWIPDNDRGPDDMKSPPFRIEKATWNTLSVPHIDYSKHELKHKNGEPEGLGFDFHNHYAHTKRQWQWDKGFIMFSLVDNNHPRFLSEVYLDHGAPKTSSIGIPPLEESDDEDQDYHKVRQNQADLLVHYLLEQAKPELQSLSYKFFMVNDICCKLGKNSVIVSYQLYPAVSKNTHDCYDWREVREKRIDHISLFVANIDDWTRMSNPAIKLSDKRGLGPYMHKAYARMNAQPIKVT